MSKFYIAVHAGFKGGIGFALDNAGPSDQCDAERLATATIASIITSFRGT